MAELIAHFWSNEAPMCRNVSPVVVADQLAIATAPPRVVADWQRESLQTLALDYGDVQELGLQRTRLRWPELKACRDAATRWAGNMGLEGVLQHSDSTLMVCRAARYHHDGDQYGSKAFCNLFLSADKALDLLFPVIGRRIPLSPGTVVIFDTCQPHAVIRRSSTGFDAADFADETDALQVFMTWELPIEHPAVRALLGVEPFTPPDSHARTDTSKTNEVRRGDSRVFVDATNGHWTSHTPL
jgi:hypothetical protein